MKNLLFLIMMISSLTFAAGCKSLIDFDAGDGEEEEENLSPTYSMTSFHIDQEECEIEESIFENRIDCVENRSPMTGSGSYQWERDLTHSVKYECDDSNDIVLLPAPEDGFYFDLEYGLLGIVRDLRWPFARGTYHKDNFLSIPVQFSIVEYSTTEVFLTQNTKTVKGRWNADFEEEKTGETKTVEGTWTVVYQCVTGMTVNVTPHD